MKKTESYNVQVNKELLVKAKTMINLPEAFRALIESVVKDKICPCCGAKIKEKQS